MKRLCILGIVCALSSFGAKPHVKASAKPHAAKPHSQLAAKPHSNTGSDSNVIPVIILGGEWTTSIVFNNTLDADIQFPVTFFSQGAEWELPVRDVGPASQLTLSLPARGSIRIDFDYSSNETAVGFATVDQPCDNSNNCGGVGAYTVLRNHNAARRQDFEVSYQLGSTLGGDPQVFMFDQSSYSQMVVNLTNACLDSSCGTAVVTLELLDENGDRFYLDTEDVAPGEVSILNFAQMSSTTWNYVGMIRLTGTDNIVVTGHRINETGSFTPLHSYNYNQ
jgi:hypothetical protein